MLDDVSSAIKVIVRIPDRKDIQNLIDLTARYVAIDGDMFEQVSVARTTVIYLYESIIPMRTLFATDGSVET